MSAMESSGDNGAADARKQLRLLLPFSCKSLRIPKELAEDIGVTNALVAGASIGEVYRVEVGWDCDGAFLGHQWAEFTHSCGVSGGWLIVLRHRGGGLLTFKAFDTSSCLRKSSHPLNVGAYQSGTGTKSPRPQFIMSGLNSFMEKMVIPEEFVQNHISEAETNGQLTLLLNLNGKYLRVKAHKDWSENGYLSDGWSQFLMSNGITKDEILLLRYEGNMLFTLKVFGLDGSENSYLFQKGIRLQEKSEQMRMLREQDATSSSSGDHRTGVISRNLTLLMPSSSSCPPKLRISNELARQLGGTALLVSPLGSKVSRVEVAWDGDRVFLHRGWPEFVAKHNIGDFWFAVFRHEGGSTLTVKAFDTTCCLRQFSCPLSVATNRSDTTVRRPTRPQFVRVVRVFPEKMVLPPEYVGKYITEAETNRLLPFILSLGGKYWRVQVDKDQSGNLFFSDGWSRFLASNSINKGEALLLRDEGNMVFTVKVFGLDGGQKCFKSTKISSGFQERETTNEQDPPLSSAGKRIGTNERPSVEEGKRPTSSATLSNKAPSAVSKCTYEIGPPAWIKKEIKAYALKSNLPLTPNFCKAIGFSDPSVVTLTTSTGDGATRSWQVTGSFSSRSSPQLGPGWRSFCRDNGLQEGDVCTFKIIKTSLWDVEITRRS